MLSYRRSLNKEHIPDELEQLEAIHLLSKYSRSQSNNPIPRTIRSFDERTVNNLKAIELPLVPIRKVLAKIGGVPKHSYIPTNKEYDSRHQAKYNQLKNLYYKRGKKHQPFQYQLDEIVLGCYEHGKQFGRDTIWKKYKQNFDNLTYDTLRAIQNKRRL